MAEIEEDIIKMTEIEEDRITKKKRLNSQNKPQLYASNIIYGGRVLLSDKFV
ncbi:hypothetical protein DICPUDRAFT_159605 [Dictyostelium purpureum]|uniref:Uncharacterized protein n=1 Tax=Dictyostelium purpureum TaxID=5786 RepID=F1A4I9_DICPU|nr:uncharacterized protein DICPUDRAFT_159605 [Dictyostelium purpureum]EGC28893.1 hypothetical protein DICPUDRAFT_159605 [Dictyostelium purpureum]|eukprot:XP_003294585.1 hypothetical protein DICPUDRAFT_159605 [Dictyostelium purpureum]